MSKLYLEGTISEVFIPLTTETVHENSHSYNMGKKQIFKI